MRELAALVWRHLVGAVRGRGSLVLIGGGTLAIAAVLLLLPGGEGIRSTVVLACLVVVGVLAFGVAAWAGGLLPADRAEGSGLWLATTAPSAALRRSAAAFSGLILAVVVALLATLLLGIALPFVLDDVEVRSSESLPGLAGLRLARGPDGAEVALPPAGGAARVFEAEMRVLYVGDLEVVNRPAILVWALGGEDGEVTRGEAHLTGSAPVRIDIPRGAHSLALWETNAHAVLVVRDARVLGRQRSFLATLLLAGLVLGVAAGAMAPFAVAVSRFTSAPTATTTACVLAAAGGFRFLLPDLVVPDAGWLHDLGLRVMEATAHVAPDLSALAVLAEPGAGRALGIADLAPLVPLLVYACVGLLLVLLPVVQEPALGKTS